MFVEQHCCTLLQHTLPVGLCCDRPVVDLPDSTCLKCVEFRQTGYDWMPACWSCRSTSKIQTLCSHQSHVAPQRLWGTSKAVRLFPSVSPLRFLYVSLCLSCCLSSWGFCFWSGDVRQAHVCQRCDDQPKGIPKILVAWPTGTLSGQTAMTMANWAIHMSWHVMIHMSQMVTLQWHPVTPLSG